MKQSFIAIALCLYAITSGFSQAETEPNNTLSETGVLPITQGISFTGKVAGVDNADPDDVADVWIIPDGTGGSKVFTYTGTQLSNLIFTII